MDIKRIVLGFFAAAAVLVGCQEKEEDFGVAKIEVSTGTLTFGPSSSSQSLQVTASREWTVTGLPEWIAVDPSSGQPSNSAQTVNVTVIANDGYNREADITFSIGLMKEYVKVSQTGSKGEYDTGDGSKDRPYSASAAVDYVGSLSADTEAGPVYVKGIISSVATTYEASGTYGNASFYISDDGSTTASQFYAFQTLYLGNKKWTSGNADVKVGDEVIIYGKVVNYKGNTPETVGKGGSYVYSLNGKTEGEGSQQTEITASTVADFIAKADESTYYRLTGTVSAFKKGTNSSGKNWMQFNLADNTGSILVYGFNDGEYDKWADVIKDNGTAVITGTYQYYEKNQQHEVMNTTVESFEAGQAPVETDHGATTVSAFLAAAESTSDWYELTGVISNLKDNDQYGNFDLTDDSGTVYVYGVLSEKGGEKKHFQELVEKYGIANGGTITIKANRGSYNDKIEALNAYFVSYVPGGDVPSTETDHGATTVSAFLAAAESTSDWYELTGAISNLKDDDQYGNFDLTDDSGTVYVYGVLSEKGGEKKHFQELVEKYGIANGGTITIKANRGSYNDKIEALNAYFVSYNAQGADQPGGDDVTPTDISSIIEAADESSVAAENVYVGAITTKGYVATDGKKSIYVYGNATPSVKIGDIVKFTGTKTTYYGLPEITGPNTTKTSTGTVPYPDPVDITSTFDSYTASEAVYVKYTAKMVKSGNYTNFSVDGASELTGSLSSAPSAYYNGINEGDEVVIYGYFNGINTKNKLLNVIAVKIENKTTGETIPAEGGSDDQGGSGQEGSVVTIDLTTQGYENAEAFDGITVGDISITVDKGTNKNGPKYYTSGNAVRFYGDNSFTLKSSGKAMAKIELTFGSSDQSNEITTDTGTWSSPTWTGSASAVTFKIGGTSGHRRVAKIVVTLAE